MTKRLTRSGAPSGHVYRVERRRGGPRWYVKYRLPDGRQVQRVLGPAWTQRTRPAEGYWTRPLAEAELRRILAEAQRGTLPGMVRTGVTFADAAAEWLRYVEHERNAKPSTLADYRYVVATLNRSLGELRLEDIDVATLERWRDRFAADRSSTNRTLQKYTIALGSIFKRATRVYGLSSNPAAVMERPRLRRTKEITVLTAEEVRDLVAAAESEQDGAVYLTAAFTGLRLGELLALRWRDVDLGKNSLHVRASFTRDVESTPLVRSTVRALSSVSPATHLGPSPWLNRDCSMLRPSPPRYEPRSCRRPRLE